MPTRHLSLRLAADTLERLEARSRQLGQSRSHLARVLLEEGLRMAAHPGIVFRSGPAGRRPSLAGGPDVWEVVRVFTGVDEQGEGALRRAAELTGLTLEQVRIALCYYADFRDELDDWIRRVDDEAARAESAWQRTQDLLRR
ncbi:MAG: ribbon-helix-helix protein, CopG family [Chloroflexi bacterium]|nr:ribbon-helix-helix protein, CopG family [Chloroflexota bacterium]